MGIAVFNTEAIIGIRVASTWLPSIMYLLAIIPLMLNPFNKEKEREISEWSHNRRHGED